MTSLDEALRATHRGVFLQAVQDGTAKPFLIPYTLLGTMIVPLLWLSIPHVSRPWLYQTRWAVLAFIIVFNIHVMRVSSSTGFGLAYAFGVSTGWGIIHSMDLLIWKRPQFEAARAIKVIKGRGTTTTTTTKTEEVKAEDADAASGRQTGLRANAQAEPAGETLKRRKSASSMSSTSLAPPQQLMSEEEVEYRWQKFPAEGPFLQRLGWAADLVSNYRGAGWSYSITSIPRPTIPEIILDNSKIDESSIPRVTPSGYSHPTTEAEFLRTRITNVLIAWVVIDFVALQMTADPYFKLGPKKHHQYELPSPLAHLSPLSILLYRQVLTLVAVKGSIVSVFNASDLVLFYIHKVFFHSRNFLWRYPSSNGSFTEVLDRGLAGFWGSWWHQTFRMQFLGPSTYALKKGYLKRETFAAAAFGLFVSFLHSGLIHATGSYCALTRATKPWDTLWFFVLQGLGIVVQQQLALVMQNCIPVKVPRILRWCANIGFCLLWLSCTAPKFMDDIASGGLWLIEPVPVSIFRLLGLGHVVSFGRDAGGGWWRWDKSYWPRLHTSKHWWEAGLEM